MVKFSSSREIYNIYAICAWAYNTFTCLYTVHGQQTDTWTPVKVSGNEI